MPSGAVRSAASFRCHIRWNKTGSTPSRSPASSAPSNRPRPPQPGLHQGPGYPRRQAAPVRNEPATAHSRPSPGRDPRPAGTPRPQPRMPAPSPRTSPRPGREPGHPAGRRRPSLSCRPCGRKSPAHAAGTGRPHHATEARTAVMTPRPRRDRSPSASSDRVPARTRTRHGHPSWRSTTSRRSSASPSRTRNGRAGSASSNLVPRHDDSGSRCQQPSATWYSSTKRSCAAPATATAACVIRPSRRHKNPLRNGPTLLTKPGNGPTSLTKSELNWHRTTARRGVGWLPGRSYS